MGGHRSSIDEGGGRTLVLKMVGERASASEIADKLREEGICDLTRQAVWHYVNGLREDPAMRVAMDVAAKRYIEQGATTVTTVSNEQLEAWRRIMGSTIGRLEEVLAEFDGDLAKAFPMREDEDPIAYKGRMIALKAMFENLPKLDARLESW